MTGLTEDEREALARSRMVAYDDHKGGYLFRTATDAELCAVVEAILAARLAALAQEKVGVCWNGTCKQPATALVNGWPVCSEHGGGEQQALAEAVKDLCWRAVPHGETEDGDVRFYLFTKGTVHRLIGAAQGAGISASFRSDSTEHLPDPDATARAEAAEAKVAAAVEAARDALNEAADAWPHEMWRMLTGTNVDEWLRARADACSATPVPATSVRDHELGHEPDVRPWQPDDGDTRCQECGHRYEPWFTDNGLWNAVMGGEVAGDDDPGGLLCPCCFAVRAAARHSDLVWRFVPAPVPDQAPPNRSTNK